MIFNMINTEILARGNLRRSTNDRCCWFGGNTNGNIGLCVLVYRYTVTGKPKNNSFCSRGSFIVMFQLCAVVEIDGSCGFLLFYHPSPRRLRTHPSVHSRSISPFPRSISLRNRSSRVDKVPLCQPFSTFASALSASDSLGPVANPRSPQHLWGLDNPF